MTDLSQEQFTITNLHRLYAAGVSPAQIVDEIYTRIAAYDDKAVWITLCEKDAVLAAIADLPADRDLPLWGIPFAAKDNIDAAGIATTAGCPAFAYMPDGDATVIANLKAAGAILIGKTNLDQFATGLNGSRSPHGAPRSVYNSDYVSGGSSSGSAVATAAGFVSFALGTDTAGSGRVPAMFNGLVGIKPSRGLVSGKGVVPACASLDCVSIFSHNVAEGVAVRAIAESVDPDDAWTRAMAPVALQRYQPVIAVPTAESREFFGDAASAAAFDGVIDQVKSLGWRIREIDYTPFRAAASILYGGAPVAERYAAVGNFIDAQYDACDPTVAAIISAGKDFSAARLYDDLQEIERLKRAALGQMQDAEILMLPTTPTQYSVAAMQADPVQLNANLGTYTNFVNLFDMAAIAVPTGMKTDGFPFGVTLVASAFSDDSLAWFADQIHRLCCPDHDLPDLPARHSGFVDLAVVGAHLTGMPLNGQLVERDARLVETTTTSGQYTLFALDSTTPPKPGLVRAETGGASIAVEIWSLSAEAFGTFTELVPPPLAIGNVELADGRWVKGFVCEPAGLAGARDITSFGGWKNYMATT